MIGYLYDSNTNVIISKIVGNVITYDNKIIGIANFMKYYITSNNSLNVGNIFDNNLILDDLKTEKINKIRTNYNIAITGTFMSTISGESKNFSYSTEAQKDFNDIFLLKSLNSLQYPETIFTVDFEPIQINSDSQLIQLVNDIKNFKQTLITKQYTYISQVNACTTEDQINAINIEF